MATLTLTDAIDGVRKLIGPEGEDYGTFSQIKVCAMRDLVDGTVQVPPVSGLIVPIMAGEGQASVLEFKAEDAPISIEIDVTDAADLDGTRPAIEGENARLYKYEGPVPRTIILAIVHRTWGRLAPVTPDLRRMIEVFDRHADDPNVAGEWLFRELPISWTFDEEAMLAFEKAACARWTTVRDKNGKVRLARKR